MKAAKGDFSRPAEIGAWARNGMTALRGIRNRVVNLTRFCAEPVNPIQYTTSSSAPGRGRKNTQYFRKFYQYFRKNCRYFSFFCQYVCCSRVWGTCDAGGSRRQEAAGRPRGEPEFCYGAAGRAFGEVIVQKSESPGVSLLTRPGLRWLLPAGAEFHFSSCCRLV